MNVNRLAGWYAALASLLATAVLIADDGGAAVEAEASDPDAPASARGDLTIEEARGQARLLHGTYNAALRTIHRRYFDAEEKEAIPAKALEDMFPEIDEGTGRTTRWISVNTPAMNVDHEPRDGFEKQAAEALAEGKKEFESVEGSVYHRAGEVRLVASCLKCHLSSLTRQVQKDRVAALVISIPVRTE
jgi:hypothetical protein